MWECLLSSFWELVLDDVGIYALFCYDELLPNIDDKLILCHGFRVNKF